MFPRNIENIKTPSAAIMNLFDNRRAIDAE
jgi:hypothetical protein